MIRHVGYRGQVIAIGSIRWTWRDVVQSLNDAILAVNQILRWEPFLAATVDGSEQIGANEVGIGCHPCGVVRSVHTGIGSDVWIECVVVLDGRWGGIIGTVLVASPIITSLSLRWIFIRTVGRGWEVLGTAFYSLSKEVVLFEGNITHPCWIVSAERT